MSTVKCKNCGRRIKLQDYNEHKRTHTEEESVYNSIENELKILIRLYKKSGRDQEIYKQRMRNYRQTSAVYNRQAYT